MTNDDIKQLIERLNGIKHYDAHNWYEATETAHQAARILSLLLDVKLDAETMMPGERSRALDRSLKRVEDA